MAATLLQETGFSRERRGAFAKRKTSPTWLRDARLRRGTPTNRLPMPARTDEEWRRTDLRAPQARAICIPFAESATRSRSARGAADPAFENDGVADALGRTPVSSCRKTPLPLAPKLDPELAAQGVIFSDLDTAVREHPELVKQYFMTEAVPVDFGKFEALHAAFWQGGTFLYVPKGVTVELRSARS